MTLEDNETEVSSSGERIAVLGAQSPTGRHFCRLALDAGYVVQALIPPPPSPITTTTATATTTSSTKTLTKTSSNDNNGNSLKSRRHRRVSNKDDDSKDDEEEEEQEDDDDEEGDYDDDDDNDTNFDNRANNNDNNNTVVFLEEASTTEQLIVVQGALDHGPSLEAVLDKATFVVCFVSETLPKRNRDYHPQRKFLASWMPQLYTLMKETANVRVFLYQANWLAVGGERGDEPMPIVSQVWKVLMKWHQRLFLKDQDAVIRYMAAEHTTDDWFQFIITRPGMVCEGPSRKKLHASKSLPGPIPITHYDLAEFSLQALKMEQLYGTSPYIVGDGF